MADIKSKAPLYLIQSVRDGELTYSPYVGPRLTLAFRLNQGSSLRNPYVHASVLVLFVTKHQPPPKPLSSSFTTPLTTPFRVSVSPECITAFNDLKLGKSTKWIIYKISDDWKEIVVEETSSDPDWGKFREKLLNAKSKDKRGKEGMGGRYAVFDVEVRAWHLALLH